MLRNWTGTSLVSACATTTGTEGLVPLPPFLKSAVAPFCVHPVAASTPNTSTKKPLLLLFAARLCRPPPVAARLFSEIFLSFPSEFISTPFHGHCGGCRSGARFCQRGQRL